MFHVRWLQTALNELTTLWTQADSEVRKEITAAAHELDQALAADPHDVGESRAGNVRVAFVYPLAVRFQIEADDRTVTVLHLRTFHRPHP